MSLENQEMEFGETILKFKLYHKFIQGQYKFLQWELNL